MVSLITGLFDFLCDNFGIFGIMIMSGFIMLWWVIALFLLIGLFFLGLAVWATIEFMRHPVANYRKLKEEFRVAKEEEARYRAYVPTYDYSPSTKDDDSSGGGDSGGQPNNGGGPDEYGPTPGYGGMGGP